MSNKKTYSEKLRDPRWQKKRLEILNADNWTCTFCEDKETTLHVHHKKYEKGVEPWDYPNDNFRTLCERCHADITAMEKIGDSEIMTSQISSINSGRIYTTGFENGKFYVFISNDLGLYPVYLSDESIDYFIKQIERFREELKNNPKNNNG